MTKKELIQDIKTAKGLLEVNEVADAHLFLDKLKKRIWEEGISSKREIPSELLICAYELLYRLEDEYLCLIQDEGPEAAGWQSTDLQKCRKKVRIFLNNYKKYKNKSNTLPTDK